MASQFNKKIYVLHDFNIKLSMYNLTKNFQIKINQKVKNNIIFISIDDFKKVDKFKKEIKIYWGNRLNGEMLEKLSNLKWIHYGSSGVNYNLKNQIAERKIKLTRSNKIMIKPVVSSILFQILFLARDMFPLLEKKRYDRITFENNFDNISDFFDEKFLIFGHGDIAKLLNKSLNKIGTNSEIVKLKELKKILKNKIIIKKIQNSKFIINCLPLNDGTKNFFDKKIFKYFKNTFFINAGRGETVNDKDLIRFIETKKINTSALDVFNKNSYISPYRPLNYSSKLWKNKKILITPHIAGWSNKYWKLQIQLFISEFNKKLTKNLFG